MVSPTQLCWRYHSLPPRQRYVLRSSAGSGGYTYREAGDLFVDTADICIQSSVNQRTLFGVLRIKVIVRGVGIERISHDGTTVWGQKGEWGLFTWIVRHKTSVTVSRLTHRKYDFYEIWNLTGENGANVFTKYDASMDTRRCAYLSHR